MRRMFVLALAFAMITVAARAADKDSKAAAQTRTKLKKNVTVEFKDELFKTVLDELAMQAKVKFKPDLKGGISQNRKVSYAGKDKPLEEVLDGILKKEGWGYVVLSNEKDVQYDGAIVVKVGKERGYEEGKEPDKSAAKTDEKSEKKPPVKEKPPAKTEAKEKPPAKEPPPSNEDETERKARNLFKVANDAYKLDGNKDKAKQVCEEVIRKYPKSAAADDAKKLLEKIDQ